MCEDIIIDISTSQLMAYWTERLGVTETLLKEAIHAAGDTLEDVEVYIENIITYYMHTYVL